MNTENQPQKWTVEFNELGGYDMMTPSWDIKSGPRTITIDCGSWRQEDIDREKQFARFVMHALNAYEKAPR